MITKKELINKCRKILYQNKIIEEDKIFLEDLLKSHPQYESKKGCGIKDFFIKKTIYGTLGFNVVRLDNSTTDFSFIECISPKNRLSKIKSACRNCIRFIIEEFKIDKNKVVHHEVISFDDIFNNWFKENKELDFNINKSKDNCQEIYFTNKETIKSFVDYHNKYATLIELSIDEHKIKHNKK